MISTSGNEYILDDKSYDGPFSYRRLSIKAKQLYRRRNGFEYERLYPLREVIHTEESLIAYLAMNDKHTFIDSAGKVYKHAPTTFYKLKCHKVLRVGVAETKSLVWVEGVNTPFSIKRSTVTCQMYAGILHLGERKILAGLLSSRFKDTRRKL